MLYIYSETNFRSVLDLPTSFIWGALRSSIVVVVLPSNSTRESIFESDLKSQLGAVSHSV